MRLLCKLLVLCMVLLAVLSACSTASEYRFGRSDYRPTDPDRIQLFFHDMKPSKPYREIGYLVVGRDGGMDGAYDKFVTKAADMGADAVVQVKIEVEYGYWRDARKFSGIAVKYVRGGNE